MSELPTLISDLAIILVAAGVMTLIFKRLKQPLVLGYIVAGILAGPHFPWAPTIVDSGNIKIWADIGVVFLLFALGLEFSFKKLMKVGGPAIIASLTIICGMVMLGYAVGVAIGWKQMDCIFLGGMLAMSSTSIIYKAIDDLGLRAQRFTGLVFGILVIEDLVAIVLMVMLSTMAVSQNFEGMEMAYSIAKLAFFLLLWFIIGIYVIPTFFRRTRFLMGDETMLIVSIGLCLGMVVLATYAGFSSALGAFVMGSILLAGQPLKTAIQSGFCLTQIGEFAFIIASLGTSLGVTSDFLYPIVVAVSVITTFCTPYMIRAAAPATPFIERHLPRRWLRFLDHYSAGTKTVNHESKWRSLLSALTRIVLIYSVIVIAILILSFKLLVPLVEAHISGFWGDLICAVLILLLISPFLRAIVAKKNHSELFRSLWEDSYFSRAYLVSLIVFRFVLVIAYIMFVLTSLFDASVGLLLGVACFAAGAMFFSRYLKKQSIQIERKFLRNFNVRESYARNAGGKVPPRFAGHLLSRDLHMSDFTLPAESSWAGCTLAELALGTHFGVMVVAIFRGKACINIPGGSERLFPQDRIQVIGSDKQLERFAAQLRAATSVPVDSDLTQSEVCLKQFVITDDSPLNGKTLRESGIRDRHHCVVVGVERGETSLRNPGADTEFQAGDLVWVVGEEKHVYELLHA